MSTEKPTTDEVLEDRGKQYGNFADVSKTAQVIKGIKTPDMNNVQREAIDMIATKMARLLHGDCNDRDTWLDISNYAKLVVIDLDRIA